METDRKNFEERIKRAYDFLSRVSVEASRDIFLLSNQVISKNPLGSNFLNSYLFRTPPLHHSLSKIVIKIFRYYGCSIAALVLYVVTFITLAVVKAGFKTSDSDDELIIVDTFFLADEIMQAGKFQEKYFLGLEAILKKLKKKYVYLPVFYGLQNPFKLYSLLSILKKDGVPILSEYQLLSGSDIIHLIYFIIVYPWHVIWFLRKLNKNNEYESQLLCSELLATIGSVTFHGYSRYLQGKRISELPSKKIKVISWYENQVIHKNLYKGLRSDKHKISIYGAQLFLYSMTDLNIIPDERELVHGVIPDTIIVNGPVFVPPSSKLVYKVGPSLRYHKLFEAGLSPKEKNHILILLSYDKNDSRNMMRIVNESELFEEKVLIKAHPATPIDRFGDLLSNRFKVVYDNVYDLFGISKIVIGCASGSLIEAASSGIPVIVVNDRARFRYDILPEYGRGMIWDEANDARDLTALVSKFENTIENHQDDIATVAGNYKKMFFSEPTQKNIIEAFDLDNR